MRVGTIAIRGAAGLVLPVLLFFHSLPAAADAIEGAMEREAPTVAFYYGVDIPPELAIFDTVVVQPEHAPADPGGGAWAGKLAAYVSVGEVESGRAYAEKVPREWVSGKNEAWGSAVVDQTVPGWPEFFVREVIAPLWQQGFRGFFLDTLDSYHLIARTPEERAAQEDGLVRLVRTVKHAYPQARLIFNRGFEVLPQLHELAYAVVAESLFQGWNNGNKQFVAVSGEDRAWLLAQLHKVRDEYRLPVIVLDYAPANDRAAMRQLASQIRAQSFVPWVSTPALDAVGVGAYEIVPRRVLLIYDAAEVDSIMVAPAHDFLAMPLNYLGLVPEYRAASEDLPEEPLAGRYAGVVVWLAAGNNQHARRLRPWLKSQIAAGVPVALLNHPGMPLDQGSLSAFGVGAVKAASHDAELRVTEQSEHTGFEIAPPLAASEQPWVRAPADAQVWLRLANRDGTSIEPVAITSWGGYAFAPHAVAALANDLGARWVIDPFAFLSEALRLPSMPVPDVTTENGHRLLITHIDGDGFANRAEFAGSPYASQVLLEDVLQRYRIPTTVSVIQGETAANGAYPKFSKDLEAIARRIFALPHVEIASHTFSHPFDWGALERGERASTAYPKGLHLPIPGYQFDAEAEIDGSIRYIDEKLAPKGKKTKVLLWSGNCDPSAAALARTDALGIGNMNGGYTTITDSQRTLTEVAPLGIAKGAYFQVYAPNQNENVYTGDWTGPYYGFERVLETFELTETPRRLKPVNIYYHVYSASKPASLKALRKVYDWALEQDLLPIYASEYIAKAQEFNRIVIARDGEDWRIFGAGLLKTLRIPRALGYPDTQRSDAVAGYVDHDSVRYIHLGGAAEARLVLQPAPAGGAYVQRAGGVIRNWHRDAAGAYAFSVQAHTRGWLEMAQTHGCTVKSRRNRLKAGRDGAIHLPLSGSATVDIAVNCPVDEQFSSR